MIREEVRTLAMADIAFDRTNLHVMLSFRTSKDFSYTCYFQWIACLGARSVGFAIGYLFWCHTRLMKDVSVEFHLSSAMRYCERWTQAALVGARPWNDSEHLILIGQSLI